MGQKTIDMRWIDAHLAIIPIMGMARRAEHASRHGSRNFFIAASQQKRIRPAAHLLRFLDEQLHGMFFRSRNEKAQTIEQTARADPHRLSRDIRSKPTFSTNAAAAAVVFSPQELSQTCFDQPP